jgi:hypothetical protein
MEESANAKQKLTGDVFDAFDGGELLDELGELVLVAYHDGEGTSKEPVLR